MNIPYKAIEAAARADYENVEQSPWVDAHSDDRKEWLNTTRIALEAAAPYLYAQALREAADEIAHEIVPGDGWDRRSIDVELLRARADDLDPHE